jgi:hypothetical protein
MPERRFLHERKASYGRRINKYKTRQHFLIVCEGEKTEPNYFKRFPLPPDSIVDVQGIGANTVSLVIEALRLKSEAKYHQVWCVFDRDSFPPGNFNAALQMAAANDVHVAYSNEAFELWYVLHFDYLNTGINRSDYITCLDRKLGHEYQKNSETIYNEIYAWQAVAIRNAKRLLAQYSPLNPVSDNPSTTVHLLVEQLNRLFWD